MDHQNTGGFERIKKEFIAAHGLDTVRSATDNTEQLSGDLRSAFVSFHANKTNDYSLCKMLTIEEHRRITKQRMDPESEL